MFFFVLFFLLDGWSLGCLSSSRWQPGADWLWCAVRNFLSVGVCLLVPLLDGGFHLHWASSSSLLHFTAEVHGVGGWGGGASFDAINYKIFFYARTTCRGGGRGSQALGFFVSPCCDGTKRRKMWKLSQYSFFFSGADAVKKTLFCFDLSSLSHDALPPPLLLTDVSLFHFFLFECFPKGSVFAVVSRWCLFRCLPNVWWKPKGDPAVFLRATWTKYAPERLVLASSPCRLASAWCTPLTECTGCGQSCYRHFIFCTLPCRRFTATFFSHFFFLRCWNIACLALVELRPKFKLVLVDAET